MELPDYEPTPPGIPAKHIDPDEHRSLFEYAKNPEDEEEPEDGN